MEKQDTSKKNSGKSKQVRLKCKLFEELKIVPGKTVSDKVDFIFNALRNKDGFKSEVNND